METGPTDPWREPKPNHREKNSDLASFQPLDSIHACSVSQLISLISSTVPSPQNTVVFIITLKCVGASCFAAASLDKDTNIQHTHNKLFLPSTFSACNIQHTDQPCWSIIFTYWYSKHRYIWSDILMVGSYDKRSSRHMIRSNPDIKWN